MKLGAYDYIPKPFTPEELRNAVSQAIGAKDPKKSMRETLVLEILDRTSDDPDFFRPAVHGRLGGSERLRHQRRGENGDSDRGREMD